VKTAHQKLGLDKPCLRCGQPIYYAYKGPVPGVCGRCVDRIKPKSRPYKSVRRGGEGTGRGKTVLLWLLLALGSAAALYFLARPYLPF